MEVEKETFLMGGRDGCKVPRRSVGVGVERRFRKKMIRAVYTKYNFLRFSVWIGSVCSFTFRLVRIRSPLS
jgi:hypothetical protein